MQEIYRKNLWVKYNYCQTSCTYKDTSMVIWLHAAVAQWIILRTAGTQQISLAWCWLCCDHVTGTDNVCSSRAWCICWRLLFFFFIFCCIETTRRRTRVSKIAEQPVSIHCLENIIAYVIKHVHLPCLAVMCCFLRYSFFREKNPSGLSGFSHWAFNSKAVQIQNRSIAQW